VKCKKIIINKYKYIEWMVKYTRPCTAAQTRMRSTGIERENGFAADVQI
jgi:hypothetical protein